MIQIETITKSSRFCNYLHKSTTVRSLSWYMIGSM